MYSGATSVDWGSIAVMAVYLVALVIVGWFIQKRKSANGDFWTGGKSVGPFATAMSFCAAYFSTVAVIGGPAVGAQWGAGYHSLEQFTGVYITCFAMFIVIGLKMNVLASRTGAVSLPGYFAARYESNTLRIVSAIIIAVMMVPYGISCFKGIASAMQVVAGVPYVTAIIILAIASLLYMLLSGYLGVATIDIIHGFFILAGMVAIAVVVCRLTGGPLAALDLGTSVDPSLGHMPGPVGTWPLFLSYGCIWSVIAWGQPHLITKFMALKDSKTISTVSIVSVVWYALFAFVSIVVMLGGRGLFDGQLTDWDLMTPTIAYMSNSFLVRALFLIACIAAGLSTLVSLAMSAASALCKDLYEDGYLAKKGKSLTDAERMRISRIFTVIVMIVMVITSIKPFDAVWMLATMASGTMGAAFVAPLSFGMYYKKATAKGAIAAVIGGAVTCVIGYLMGLGSGVIHPFMPGLAVSLILFYAVSACTQKPSQDTIDMCFEKSWRKGTVKS